MAYLDSIQNISDEVIECKQCPRLREHCEQIARVKRKQFQKDVYWGKPVPGFGDPEAKVLVVGLAPAAHGANRTGRMFTGDQSGLWLYRALFRAGFSNQPSSESAVDSLKLKGVYITAVARCAPPENKPHPEEILHCSQFLKREIAALKEVKVFLVLGQIALKGLWSVLPESIRPIKSLPKFSHGAEFMLNDGRMIVCSYHPSQQNTFTGKLTEPMFDSIFTKIHQLC
jgi:uracil-DNA glycosylase family 4